MDAGKELPTGVSSCNTHKAQSPLVIAPVVTAVKLERARSAKLPLSPRAATATVTAVTFTNSATLPRTSSEPFPSKAQHAAGTGLGSLTPSDKTNAVTAAAAQAFADAVATAPRIAVSDKSASSVATTGRTHSQLGTRSDSIFTEGMALSFDS